MTKHLHDQEEENKCWYKTGKRNSQRQIRNPYFETKIRDNYGNSVIVNSSANVAEVFDYIVYEEPIKYGYMYTKYIQVCGT